MGQCPQAASRPSGEVGAPPELHSQPCWLRHWVGAGRAEQSCPSERNWASKGPAEIPVGLRDWPHHGPGPLVTGAQARGQTLPSPGPAPLPHPHTSLWLTCSTALPGCISFYLSLLSFFFFKLYLAALDLSCSTRDLQSSLKQMGSNSLTRDRTQVPCIGS